MLAGFGVPSRMAQRAPGDGLGAGGAPDLPGPLVVIAGPARMLDRRGVVGIGDGGSCGPLP